MYTSAILLGLLPTVFAHMGLFHESGFGFNGDGYSLADPLAGKSFDQWWFHGNLNTPKVATIANKSTGNLNQKPTGTPMSLPAGGTVTVEVACHKDFTSYGNKGDGKNACPTDSKS